MAEVLSEIKIGARIIEPVVKALKKKPEMFTLVRVLAKTKLEQ